MIHDPPADVIVIGAGFGGAAFSWRLSQRVPGVRLACFERGGWTNPSDMPASSRGWQRAVVGAWSASPNQRLACRSAASADYAIDDLESPIKPLMWSGVGGSTINWSAHFPRLHPSDFQTRTLDEVGDDWPFSYFDLEPYYDVNDVETGVSGLAGDPAYPPKPARPMPPLPLGRLGERAADAFNELGWHWWPVDAAINSVPHSGREACNNCGPCAIGCVRRAKSSVDATYWPKAIAAGVELNTRCVVHEVLVEAGRATGVRYRDRDGIEHERRASFVVVAGNGIGTARLLLASNIGGGADNAVGRCLMFHPAAYARGMFRDELDGPCGPVGAVLYSHEFYETDQQRGFVRGVQLQVTRENAPLVQALRLEPAWGRSAVRRLREEFRHSMAVLILVEDLPESHNRVSIGRERAADGLPDVKLHYRLSSSSARMLEFGLARAEELLRTAGAYRVVRVSPAPYTGWHLLGTARMGADPGRSVTDARGRCHAVPNLLVVDGSVFPTAGAVNPGSTIGALALKFADDLARDFGR